VSPPRWIRQVLGLWLGLLLVDGVLVALTGRPTLAYLLAVGLAVPLALAAPITPWVPARVVGPGILFLGWAMLGAMPLPVWLDLDLGRVSRVTGALQGLVAVGLGLVALRIDPRTRPPTDPGRSVVVGLLGLLGVPGLVLGYGWWSTVLAIDVLTAGYLELGRHGLVSVERAWVRGGTTVRLVGMAHIGEATGYASMQDAFARLDDAVLLAEGVSDDRDLLDISEGGYDKAAKRIGLVEQPPPTAFGLDVIPADVDVARFHRSTREFLEETLAIWSADDPWPLLMAFATARSRDEAAARAMLETLYVDLIVVRNAHLLQTIETAAEEHAHIVVPWGAGHMPGLSAGLAEAGFVVTGEPVRRVLIGP